MDLRPTRLSAEEIAIENGWTCRSELGTERVTTHSRLYLSGQKIMVFANQQLFIECYECEHCGLKMDIVRPPKGPLSPESDHAERCARPGCGHLKHQHYHTVEGPFDGVRTWVRKWCQYVRYEGDSEHGCTCRSYLAPKSGSGASLLPSAEVEDVHRSA